MTSLLIIHPDLTYYGGAELVITKLCQYLSDHNIPHDVLTRSVSDEVRALTPGTEYITISPAWQGKWQTGTTYAFLQYLKTHTDWDVINAHNYPAHLPSALSTMPTVWLCNEPPAYHIQYQGIHHPADLFKKVVLAADKLVVRSRISDVIVADTFNQERFRRLYNLPSHIIPYGIDYDFFSKGDAQVAREHYHLNDRFVLLHVGMFTPLKNQLESVRCLQKFLESEPDAVLVLAGQGGTPYEAEIRRYVHDHHLNDVVIFTGHVSRKEIRDLYHAADIALFPVLSQGSWLSPLEALCAATPVIVSPDITSSQMIHEQQLGTITREYTIAVQHIHTDYAAYQNQAKQARDWVKEHLRWDRFCRELYERCEGVLKR